MTEPASPPPPRLSRLALGALALAVAAGAVAALAGFGARWDLWHFRTGFTMLRWAAWGGIAIGVVCAAAAVRAWLTPARRGALVALTGLAICLVVVLVPWQWQRTARSVPPIHDITTDTEDPPEFVAVVPLRADARNPVEYPGEEVAARQQRAYPHIRPLELDVPPGEAFDRALAAVRRMGWRLVAADPAAGRIEATDRTFWFGFYDDVVVRVRETPDGARIDVRSKSRVGGSDVGTNARRIDRYLAAVRR